MALGGADGDAGKRTRQREKQAAGVTLPLEDPSVTMEDKTLERSKVKVNDAEESPNEVGSCQNASPLASLWCDCALEQALMPQTHMSKAKDASPREHVLTASFGCEGVSCVLVQHKDLSCPVPGQCSSLDPVSELSKSYPERQAGCPGERG